MTDVVVIVRMSTAAMGMTMPASAAVAVTVPTMVERVNANKVDEEAQYGNDKQTLVFDLEKFRFSISCFPIQIVNRLAWGTIYHLSVLAVFLPLVVQLLSPRPPIE